MSEQSRKKRRLANHCCLLSAEHAMSVSIFCDRIDLEDDNAPILSVNGVSLGVLKSFAK